MKQHLLAFFQELRRRNVIRVASLYAIAAWLLIQIAATTFPYLGFSKGSVTLVIALLLIGFPITLIVSWLFKMVGEDDIDTSLDTVESPIATSKANSQEPADTAGLSAQQHATGFWVILSAISLVIAIIIFNIIDHTEPAPQEFMDTIKSEKIAVLIFENNTGQADLNIIGKMASDWITQALIEAGDHPSIVSYSTVNRFAQNQLTPPSEGIAPADLNSFTGAAYAISGAYYLQGDSLIFQAQILDTQSGETLYSFAPEHCHFNRPLAGIESLSDRLAGYWVTRNKQVFFSSPPSYQAYLEYLASEEFWASDYDLAYEHLEKAVELDSSFMAPRFKMAFLYFNIGNYPRAEEIVNFLEQHKEQLNSQQSNLLSYFKALLRGDNRSAYDHYQKEYQLDNRDLFINTTMAIMAQSYQNRPAEAIKILQEIDPSTYDLESCTYCYERIDILAEALLALGQYDQVLEVLRQVPNAQNKRNLQTLHIRALARLGRHQAVISLLERIAGQEIDYDFRYLYYSAAREYALLNQKDRMRQLGEQALQLYQDDRFRKNSIMLGRTFYLLEEWEEAHHIFQARLDARPKDRTAITHLGAIAARRGQADEALRIIEELDQYDRPYSFGYIAYHRGRIYSLLGQPAAALDHLGQSLDDGRKFLFTNFKHDPDLRALWEHSSFKQLIEPAS